MAHVTLDSVLLSFEEWRLQKSNQREAIPEPLWAQAESLYPQHKISEICRRLGLSCSQLKKRLDKTSREQKDSGFVLATAQIERSHPSQSSEVLLRIEGKRRDLTITVGLNTLSHILPHLEDLL